MSSQAFESPQPPASNTKHLLIADPSARFNATFSSNSCLVIFPGDVKNIKVAPAIASCLVSTISRIVTRTGNFLRHFHYKHRLPYFFSFSHNPRLYCRYFRSAHVCHPMGTKTCNMSLYRVTSAMLYPPGVSLWLSLW
ncbi:unnamed protein product [Pocillopora meandrina]|uniref:Uncharacterized protein n=1 Tax=Pocillopora meandrina TaxID=46732 RepID=A0AAU9WJP5_9CNID|nr:unnamed protein product [Pocillopora meandrina]